MSNRNYILVIKEEFEAIDDIEAREKANKRIEKLGVDKVNVKLQRLENNNQPQGIKL